MVHALVIARLPQLEQKQGPSTLILLGLAHKSLHYSDGTVRYCSAEFHR
jgi:hypothetical protein